MIARLCVCLTMMLVIQIPAQGQVAGKSGSDLPATSLDQNAWQSHIGHGADFQSAGAHGQPRGADAVSAASFASRIFELIATRNALDLFRQSAGGLDAYLRPPTGNPNDDDVFRMAQSALREVTSIRSEDYEIAVDPLKMRCVVRINLNRVVER